jgi:DNA-binding PadR family transcriptional regulator
VSVRNGLLALLADGNHHGYELRKELEVRTGALWDLNVGQVYTTLARLERDGYVVAVGAESDGTGGESPSDADTREDGTRDQRQYALTEAGRAELATWYREPRRRPAPDRDELVIKITLAAQSPDVNLDDVIDAQRRVTTEELQRYTRAKARAEEGDLARLMALDAVVSQIDAELRWLEQCRQRYSATGSGHTAGRSHGNKIRGDHRRRG